MAAPLAIAPLLAGAGKLAMGKLPLLMAAGAALPSIRQGRFGEAALQGGLGYLGGGALMGPAGRLVPRMAGGLSSAVQKMAPGLATKLGADLLPAAAGVSALGLGAGALALGGAMNPASSGVVQGAQQGLGNVAQAGAGLIGYTADGKPVYGNIGGGALPPGMGQYGPTSPYGSPLDVLGPAGMGQRLQTLKDAQTQRDVFRTLMPEVMGVREATAKKDFERNMAAAGIRQNIRTRAEMQRAAQDAGIRAGLGALQQAGTALTNQYQYQ